MDPTTSTARFNQNPSSIASRPSNTTTANSITQPTPQALPKRSGPSSIIVSPRQKGNPILTHIKSLPWEYGDIAPDYLLGVTTCALFLSLKYHRLHPEYIYSRIRALAGKYALRVLLCMVDITAHEESIRELTKTSLINNVTIVLCWTTAEAGRYLELFKMYEHVAPTSIRSRQSESYADRMMEFVTRTRGVNKTDAVGLVGQFGCLRAAVNAKEEEVGGIAGWGEVKVRRWCRGVREGFRVKRAGKRGVLVTEETREEDAMGEVAGVEREDDIGEEDGGVERGMPRRSVSVGRSRPAAIDADSRPADRIVDVENDVHGAGDGEQAFRETRSAPVTVSQKTVASEFSKKRKAPDDSVSDGVMAALSKLRKDGG